MSYAPPCTGINSIADSNNVKTSSSLLNEENRTKSEGREPTNEEIMKALMGSSLSQIMLKDMEEMDKWQEVVSLVRRLN